MTKFSLTARWVLPIDGDPLEGGVVTVDDGVIVSVGDRSIASETLHDLGDAVLLPGLVNAHTHLEFSQLPEPLGTPGMSLPDWIRLVIADRNRTGRDSSASISAGLNEGLACGVTSLGDIATSPQVDHSQSLPHQLAFHEVIGFSAARLESAFSDLQQRVGDSRDSTSRRSSGDNLTTTGISPHAAYTVHPQLLERLVNEARSEQLPVAMHLAESPAELELLVDGTGPFRELLEERSMWDSAAIPSGTTQLDYLRVLARAPRVIVVHGNYLSADEIEFLVRQRAQMSVVYCPRTHAYFQHTEYPLKTMLAAGVRVALGTDSRASNPDLCLLSEMRCVARQHGLSPTEIVRLGTLAGAETLGWGSHVGSIAPGKWADLIAVPCGSADPAEAVLQHEGPPTHVWLRGQPISSSEAD